MNKHIRNISLVLAGFASAVAFQNCSPAKLVETSPVLASKPEATSVPEIVPPAPVQVETPSVSLGLASKLLKNRKWILDSYMDGNDEVSIDETAKIRFEMSKTSVDDEDRICAGDCGRAFPISGSSLCGDFKGYMKVRFLESRGVEALSFSITDLEDVCSSEDIIDGEATVAIIDQIFQDLDSPDKITVRNDKIYVRAEDRTSIFKADKADKSF